MSPVKQHHAPGQSAWRHTKAALLLCTAAALAPLGLQSSAQAATSITRTSAFDYDSATGLLNKEIIEPGRPSDCVVTSYTLDAFGNRTGATTRNCNGSLGSSAGVNDEAGAPTAVSQAGFTSRSVSTTYSSDGRFAVGNTNALLQSETKTYDTKLGVIKSLTGPNGLSTTWAYDDLGRKVLEKRADGNGTRLTYKYCNSVTVNGVVGSEVCPTIAGAVGAYVLSSTPVKAPIDVTAKTDGGANGAYSKSYHDTLGRLIRSETQGADLSGTSTLIYQDTEYNALGQVSRQSKPYFAGATTIQWASNTYDGLGRVIQTTRPDGSKTTTSYAGLTVSATNDKGQTISETRNVAGQVVTIVDANNKTLSKTYDAYGNLLTTTDALGNVVTLSYDLKGRKKTMKDPDMGYWFYWYNALGELTMQGDAKAQYTYLDYDVLGRLTYKEEDTQTSSWYYDKNQDGSACAQGIGKLCEVVSGNGYARKHNYDSMGRPISTTSTIGSAYTVSTSYNSDGRAETLTYPGSNLKLKNVYTALGYLKQVINSDAPSSVYWKAEAIDAEGHLTQQTTGNLVTTLSTFDPKTGNLKTTKAGASGSTSYAVQDVSYAYDTLGNLTSSSDTAAGASAVYGYDSLNRLSSEVRMGLAVPTATSITWGYNEIGNITSRSDVGTYTYPASGASSVRPHAVSAVAGTVNGTASPSYAYDANGNLSSATGRTVSWTSFNKVQSISRTVGSDTNTLDYLYDAEGERVKETYSKNGVLQRTTIYLNPGAGAGLFYEEEITPAGTKKKHYLSAGGGTIGVLTLNTVNTSWTTQYWHKDLLGSTVVVTDGAGVVTERMSYEPFGKRRNVNGTTDLLATLMMTTTRRGFTGHEMMDEIGLVNMNGRVYDPAIGRFLSADPYIQAPDNMQSYNRYSYVMNSPLGGVDPSGYNWISKHWHRVWRSELGQAIIKVGIGVWCGPAAGACMSAYAGAYTAYKGGNLRQVLTTIAISDATQFAFGFVGDKFTTPIANTVGHAVVGCASAAASGGDCGAGAAAAGFGAAVSNYASGDFKLFANSVPGQMMIGGTASVLAGGKFADGAIISASGYLFNFLAHQKPVINPNGIGENASYALNFASDLEVGMRAADDSLMSKLLGPTLDRGLRALFNIEDVRVWAVCKIESCYGTRNLPSAQQASALRMDPAAGQVAATVAKNNRWDLGYLSRSQAITVLETVSSRVNGFEKAYGAPNQILDRMR